MKAFDSVVRIVGTVAPLLRDNVDTDAIIPSREIRSTGKTGLADGLFAGWRYLQGRTPDPDFVLNQPSSAEVTILVGGETFGSGSSREHAVWALREYGFRAVVAGSFAPIFQNNCIRNGLVPAAVGRAAAAEIAREIEPVTVDVEAGCVLLADGRRFDFRLDGEARTMLMEGLDTIDLTLKHASSIARFLAADRPRRPWVYFGDNE